MTARRSSPGWLAFKSYAAFGFVVLSLAVFALGWTLTQFDSQYEASSLAERAPAGVLAGAFAAVIYSPVSATLSVAVGAIAASITRLRRAAN